MTRKEFIEFFEENKDKFDDNEILVEEIKDAPNKYGTKIFLIKELAQYPDEHDEYCFEISFTTVIIDRKRKDVCDRKYFHDCGRAHSALGLWKHYKDVMNYIFLYEHQDQFKFYYNDFIKNIKGRIKSKNKNTLLLYQWNFGNYITFNLKMNIKTNGKFYFILGKNILNRTLYGREIASSNILQSFSYEITDTHGLKQIYNEIKKKVLYELYNINLTKRIE